MGVASLDLQQTDAGQGKIDYGNIVNKPMINGVTLEGDLSTEDINIFVPQRVSELQNDAGYITKNVSDLVFYYDKTEVDNMISTIPKFDIKVVDALPTEDISPTTIYLLMVAGEDHYEEYIYVDDEWDKLGDGNIDLSDYATYEYVDAELAEKVDAADLATVALSGRYSDLIGTPVNLSQFTNDVGYLTEVPDGSVSRVKLSSALNADLTAVENAVEGLQNSVRGLSDTKADKTTVSALSDTVALKADKSELPTKTSDLTNDSGFITIADVPTNVSELTNDSGYITSAALTPYSTTQQMNTAISTAVANKADRSEIPTKVSDLTNDSGFVNSTQVNTALAAYTYPSQDLYTQSDIDTMLAQISSLKIEVVNTLPQTGNADTIYLLRVRQQGNDLYQEYFWVNNAWELIGGIDLTDYYTKTEVNTLLTAKADVSAIPTKTSDLTNDSNFAVDANYVHTDNNYTTAEKNKLAGIAAGAEVNVQSNWTQTNSSADDFIKNKPSIPTKTSDITNDSGFITTAAIPTNVSAFNNDAGYLDEIPDDSVGLNQLDSTIVNALNNINNKANTADLAAVAFSGDYDDLTDKPTIPTKTSDLTNDSGFVTSSVNNLTNYYTKSQTYTQSEVNSLLNAIVVPTKTSDLTNDGADGTSTYVESDDLATVATSGSYNDLTDKPAVMTGLVEMSYGEANAWAKFLTAYQAKQIVYCRASSNANPGTGSQTRKAFMAYVDNAENPTNVEFQYVRSVGTKTAAQPVDQVFVYTLDMRNGGTWTVQTRNMAPKLAQGTNTTVSYSNGTYTISATQPTVPTKTSDLTNDGSDGTSTYVEANELATVATTGDYDDLTNKPTIPTVNNATLTIQKNSTNVATFTANAASNVTANISVPTATSDLTNDSGFLTSSTLPVATANSLGVVQVGSGLTVSSGGVLSATGGGVADSVAWGHVTGTLADQTDLADALAAKANSADLATVATSGSYNDLTDTPTIPSGVTLYTSLGENTDGALTQKATRELFYNDSAKSKMKIGSLGFSSDTFGSHSTSVGDLSRAAAVESTALGYNARTSGDYSIAIGSSAAIGNRSRASVIGYMSSARAVDAVALGSYALATRANEVNIGTAMGGSGYDNTQTRLLGGLHAGLLDTDAVNVGQLNSALDDKADVSDLATKQNLLSPGNHISITSDVISATGYVHSENPQSSAAASSTITGSMIANGTITADKLASDATVKLTMSTSDIGEGAPLAANTLYGVYR